MFSVGRKLHEIINSYKRSNALTAGRRVLEEARRHTSAEVQGLRDSLAKTQKSWRSSAWSIQGTSTQVEEEQQAQLTSLEKARDDAID